MQTSSLVLGLFLGSVQSLRFIDGSQEVLGDFMAQKDVDSLTGNSNLIQTAAMAAAQEGSGVRARWIELPDCGATGKLNFKIPIFDQEIIPLANDLHNASIATCKAYTPNLGKKGDKKTVTLDDIGPTLDGPPKDKGPPKKPLIYDEVMHISGKPAEDMEKHMHQVPVQMEGEVDPKPEAGPRGDFDYKGLQEAGNGWIGKEKKDDKGKATLETLIQINSSPISLNQSKWVEIPDCKGQKNEVALKEDLGNALFATCKRRPKEAVPTII